MRRQWFFVMLSGLVTVVVSLALFSPAWFDTLMDLQRTKQYVRVKPEQFKADEEAAIAAGLLQ